MPDEMTQRKIDELTGRTSTLEKDMAVAANRLHAIENRTDRMMQEAAAGRAEIHRDFEKVYAKLNEVHDSQVKDEGKKTAEKESRKDDKPNSVWLERAYKLFVPVMLTIILIAIALKDVELI